jgi:hypothetical protein
LPDLKIAQSPNYDWADDQAGEERGEAGESGAKGQIAKNSEGRNVMVEL